MNNIFESFDLNGYVNEYVTHKLFDVASIGFKNALNRINRNREIIKLKKFDKEDCMEYISQHIAENINWATNISFRDAVKSKKLTDIFIELDLFITPLKLRVDTKEKIKTIPISDLLSDTEKNIILLGQPGAGKTTSAKKIFLELILREREVYEVFSFPLVIRLKDLAFNKEDNGLILFKEILNTLGIFYAFEGTVDDLIREKVLIHIFKDFIERLDVLIILDGYDEIADKKLKDEIVRNLRLITNSLLNSKFILTSRSADYDLHIENSSEYEICPLSEPQIGDFIQKWIDDSEKSKFLLKQLKESPYWDTTMRPLTLAHLCALYERNNSIPDKPKSVYKKIIQLLLEDWTNQRSIERKSKYAKFEVDRKMDFLSRFAYELTVEYNRLSFNRNILELIYNSICTDYGLPKEDSYQVINEIESHNGLILQTGADNFEFAHKSLLEYLVSDYLVKLPLLIRQTTILKKIPNELAIWVAVSSNPNLTFFELIYNILKEECVSISFLLPFLSRVLIEKPDFEPNPLFALTNIFMLNVIAEKIHKIEEELLNAFDDEDEYEIEDDEVENMVPADYIGDDKVLSYSEEKEYYTASELKDYKNYLLECSEIIVSFKQNDVFQRSMKEMKKCYKIGSVELSRRSPKIILENWGKVFHLKQLRPSINCQSVRIDLPDNLLLIEEFNKL